jgi:D-alanine-D-alanine ligase
MIWSSKGIEVLETNTLPGMTETSLLPLAAKTIGLSFSKLLDQMIRLAMK